ncbi:MAG TPA: crosslink repair DNA glycosylase YcaQ family protein, partial [Thermoanaerobaculia bacterium]|nr:crosslink repair DNA glycosylase YcaQ family protein [Thermoanaerobaculia bacterium]
MSVAASEEAPRRRAPSPPPDRLSLPAARRVALAAQGFARPRPAGRVHRGHLWRLVERLALLQLDFVNVLVPSHYLVPFSRLGPYDRRLLDRLAAGRDFTEQWAHEASLVPVEAWPLLAHRRAEFRARPWGFARFLDERPEYVARVLDEVRRRGPLSADELPEPEEGPTYLEHSWFGSPRRAVLETFFGRGVLAVTERRDFVRRYDLAERVVPAEHLARRVEPAAAERELLRRAARAAGV